MVVGDDAGQIDHDPYSDIGAVIAHNQYDETLCGNASIFGTVKPIQLTQLALQ